MMADVERDFVISGAADFGTRFARHQSPAMASRAWDSRLKPRWSYLDLMGMGLIAAILSMIVMALANDVIGLFL